MTKKAKPRRYPSAQQASESAKLFKKMPQTLSPSYRLAFDDTDFLLRDELRAVRLQLELLKPDLVLQENGIDSTVVVFGSSRISDGDSAALNLSAAVAAKNRDPGDENLSERAAIAEKLAEKSHYYDEARAFARLVSTDHTKFSDDRLVIMTGGGSGIMEAANRGAHDAGADSIGLNIVLPFEQEPNEYISPKLCFQFHYFAIRKMHFLMRARALAIFPGGFGTLDELFDALTLIQTGKMRPIPILLFGESYWRRVLNFDVMVEEGVISPKDAKLVRYVENAEDGLRKIFEFDDPLAGS
jgi:uncharacterized protein (TIGR00730 family)